MRKKLFADIGKLPLTAESRQQIRLGHKLSGAIYFPDNDVECFVSGAELFDAFKRDLMAAQCAIDMQFYIFNDDNASERTGLRFSFSII